MIDPRGPRFSATITAVVLIAALILGPAWGWTLLAVQLVAFALGAFAGLKNQPYGVIYRLVVAPRLQPPRELEDERPPRFAQLVGLIFVVAALIGVAADLPPLFYVATAFALAASFLNAAFDFCLGCEIWVIWQRLRGRSVVRRQAR